MHPRPSVLANADEKIVTPRYVATGDVGDHVETTSQPDRPLHIGVSPFLDKTHGTERCVVEQIERLARDHACEIVVCCNDVRDLDLSREEQDSPDGRITLRKVPNAPGPQLIRFSWPILANHLVRWWDRRSGEFTPDLLSEISTHGVDVHWQRNADKLSGVLLEARYRFEAA